MQNSPKMGYPISFLKECGNPNKQTNKHFCVKLGEISTDKIESLLHYRVIVRTRIYLCIFSGLLFCVKYCTKNRLLDPLLHLEMAQYKCLPTAYLQSLARSFKERRCMKMILSQLWNFMIWNLEWLNLTLDKGIGQNV